jgi:pimeloyl-ACP methyl ester carboxylesterase
MCQAILRAIQQIACPIGAFLVVLVVLLNPVTASAAKPPEYFVDETKLPFEALPGATALWGVHKGAGYRIEVPDNWNGELVVWAHGFRGTGLELTVDDHPLRPVLIPLGYAWAASSYDRNDYDIISGVQSSHALLNRFNGLVGKPSRVYMTGASMGGHITAVAIEQYPKTFDGALPICGVVGDYALFDYFLDFNSAAQQLGIGASQYPVDPFQYIGFTVPAIKAGLEAVPSTWPFTLNAEGVNHKNLTELRSGGVRPNFDEAFAFWNSIPSATGPGNFLFGVGLGGVPKVKGDAVDNFQTVYQFDTDPNLTPEEEDLNDMIVRVAADPQARHPNGLAQVPVISGDINIPVLTLHNLGDLFVPVLNEVEYQQRVAANGKSELLVQRAIRGVGHCGFTPTEFAGAFLDLKAWVEDNIKPGGDDFSEPESIADEQFGCQFTDFTNNTPFPAPPPGNGGHIWATACPAP